MLRGARTWGRSQSLSRWKVFEGLKSMDEGHERENGGGVEAGP